MQRLPLRSKLVLAAVLLSRPVVSDGEEVILKNGTVLSGSIVQMTETDVTIDTADMGQVVVKRRTVQSISDGVNTKVPLPQTPQAPSSADRHGTTANNSGVNQTVNVNTNSTPNQTAKDTKSNSEASKDEKGVIAAASVKEESNAAQWTGYLATDRA